MALANPTVVLCFSGENTTEATITAWNSPSPSWLAIRAANSRRKSVDPSASRALCTGPFMPAILGRGQQRGAVHVPGRIGPALFQPRDRVVHRPDERPGPHAVPVQPELGCQPFHRGVDGRPIEIPSPEQVAQEVAGVEGGLADERLGVDREPRLA